MRPRSAPSICRRCRRSWSNADARRERVVVVGRPGSERDRFRRRPGQDRGRPARRDRRSGAVARRPGLPRAGASPRCACDDRGSHLGGLDVGIEIRTLRSTPAARDHCLGVSGWIGGVWTDSLSTRRESSAHTSTPCIGGCRPWPRQRATGSRKRFAGSRPTSPDRRTRICSGSTFLRCRRSGSTSRTSRPIPPAASSTGWRARCSSTPCATAGSARARRRSRPRAAPPRSREAYFARLLGLPFVAVMPRSTSAEKIAADRVLRRPRAIWSTARRDLRRGRSGSRAETGGHYMDQFTYAERATDWRGNNNIAESIFSQMALERHPVPAWIVVRRRHRRHLGDDRPLHPLPPARHPAVRRRPGATRSSSTAMAPATRRRPATDRPSRIEGIGRPRVEPSFVAGRRRPHDRRCPMPPRWRRCASCARCSAAASAAPPGPTSGAR